MSESDEDQPPRGDEDQPPRGDEDQPPRGNEDQPPREEKIWKPTDPGTGITPPVLPKEGDTSGDQSQGDQSQEEPQGPEPSREKHFGDEAIWQAEMDDSRTDPPSIPGEPD
jgi:hypothetical protein